MRRRVQPATFSHKEPASELQRFVPTDPGGWDPVEFAAFLRAREAWRDTHTRRLPALHALDRSAMHRMSLPPALVAAEDPRELLRGN